MQLTERKREIKNVHYNKHFQGGNFYYVHSKRLGKVLKMPLTFTGESKLAWTLFSELYRPFITTLKEEEKQLPYYMKFS